MDVNRVAFDDGNNSNESRTIFLIHFVLDGERSVDMYGELVFVGVVEDFFCLGILDSGLEHPDALPCQLVFEGLVLLGLAADGILDEHVLVCWFWKLAKAYKA